MTASDTNPHAPKAFVLSPFGGGWDEVYQGLIAPALSEAGYAVARADTFITHRNVLRDIVRGIRDADLVIAEITTPNPNVFYELGVAQGLGVPTVLVAQDLTDVPFDLQSYRIIQYSTDFTEVDEFREQLKSIGLEHLAGQVKFGSPVSDFAADLLPGKGENAPDSVDVQLESHGEASESVQQEAIESPGFLDHVIQLEEATGSLESLFLDITKDVTILGEASNEKAARIGEISQRPTPASPREVLRLTTSIANDMNVFAQALNGRLPELQDRTQDLVAAGDGVAKWVSDGVADNPQQVEEFRDSMADFSSVANTAVSQMVEMRDSTKTVRGVSRDLDRASRHVEASVDRLVDVMTQIESFANRADELASEALKGSPTRTSND